MSFPEHGLKGMCILSANGSISNVTLRQSSTSGGTVTYEVSEITPSPYTMLFLPSCTFCLSFSFYNLRLFEQ